MKFTVARDVLADAVNWTARTVPNRPSVAILAGIRITSADAALTLSSFDYEVATKSEIPADVAEDGDILVSGRLLSAIAKAMPNHSIECTLDGSKLDLVCGSSHFSLATMPVDEYPPLPASPEPCGAVDAHEFATAVNQVMVATSTDDAIPLLMAVRMEIDDDKITLLATDRYRLAMRELRWQPGCAGLNTAMLVKGKVLRDVAKTMATGQSLELAFDQQSYGAGPMIGFHSGTRHTTSTLMDGDYPPVRRLFPEETSIHAVVNRVELLEAVRRVSLVAPQKTTLRVRFTGDRLTLEAGQDDNAQGSEVIAASINTDSFETAYNPQFLEQGLAVIESEYVRFAYTDPQRPVVISGQNDQGEADTSFKYLLMPMRIDI